MIDKDLRSSGIGSSEIAAIMGMSPYGDAFTVYANKTGVVPPETVPTPVQRRGKYFEQGIADWYTDETGNPHEWSDTTIANPGRSWQVVTPDAWIEDRKALLEIKTVGFGQRDKWGDPGSDEIPDHYALQVQWALSATGLKWADVAACMGLDDLRIYRVHFDVEIEAVLLERGEKFWNNNVLAKNPPALGHSETAKKYLLSRFPKNIETIRVANGPEVMLLAEYKQARDLYDRAKAHKVDVENAVKQAIGMADGIQDPEIGKVTWKLSKDTMGVDYRAIAQEMARRVGLLIAVLKNGGAFRPAEWESETWERLEKKYQRVARAGTRRINAPRNWKTVCVAGEEED